MFKFLENIENKIIEKFFIFDIHIFDMKVQPDPHSW